MTTPPPIPLALSAEEWANPDGPSLSARGIDDMTGEPEESPIVYLAGRRTFAILDGPVGPITLDDPASQHGVMALANAALPDDDPRKITRADVEALRDAADYGEKGKVPEPWMVERLHTAAAKLAALLPLPAPPLPPQDPADAADRLGRRMGV